MASVTICSDFGAWENLSLFPLLLLLLRVFLFFSPGMSMKGCQILFSALLWYTLILLTLVNSIDWFSNSNQHCISELNIFCGHVLSFCIAGFSSVILHCGFLYLFLWIIWYLIFFSCDFLMQFCYKMVLTS